MLSRGCADVQPSVTQLGVGKHAAATWIITLAKNNGNESK